MHVSANGGSSTTPMNSENLCSYQVQTFARCVNFFVFVCMHVCVWVQVSEYNMPAWRSGKEDFERRMEPLEQRVSQKLRELFGGCKCCTMHTHDRS
jgi:hypothetical protein